VATDDQADAAFDRAAAAAGGNVAAAPSPPPHPLPAHPMTQCPPGAPPWLAAAWREIGAREEPENRGPIIRRFIVEGKCGEEGEPWCSIFANAKLESVGIRGTRSPSSQSFRHDANFVQLAGPALGAIVVFWRTSKASGLGHVGFYVGEGGGYIATLGGNEGDMVQVEPLPKVAGTFGLVGYYWPASLPLPQIGAIQIAAGVPAHVVSVT
jgi:uncharacterized protein (TIGR02594 family)